MHVYIHIDSVDNYFAFLMARLFSGLLSINIYLRDY